MLQAGVPSSAHVEQGEYAFFAFPVQPNASISIALTAFSGDPDLYASFTTQAPNPHPNPNPKPTPTPSRSPTPNPTPNQAPTADESTFSAASLTNDLLSIRRLDDRFCPGVGTTTTGTTTAPPCTLYVGVLGYSNASFSLLATQRRAPVARLVAGQPQHAHLDVTEWSYYRLTLPADATGFRISLPATTGDPDVFVQAPFHSAMP